jgi:NAD(P)-dependent dehydrogenase (short-subunit alcohol dehydrogenase family)
MKLSGRRALITGATSGIGRAIALRFAREGAHVALTGRRRERLADVAAEARAAGVTVVEIVADHTNPADNARAVDTTVERPRRPRHPRQRRRRDRQRLDPGPEARRVAPHPRHQPRGRLRPDPSGSPAHHQSRPGGSILNLSSMAGIRAYAQVLAYCVSKAALNTLTQCLALELAPHGVRVNAINPGVVVSELHTASGAVADYAAFLERARTTHPLGRPGQPEEIAALAVFLTSEEAGWITGGLHIADGGRSLTSLR